MSLWVAEPEGEEGKNRKAKDRWSFTGEGPEEQGRVAPTFHLFPCLIWFALLQSLATDG